MKTSLIVRALAVLLLSATSLCFAQEPEENGGILNGPLTDRNLGHRASGEGNHESLRLAIEHLSNTYGGNYPKGEEFLKRLEEVQDPDSDEFKSLKREALLVANPAIDFDQILVVRALKGGKRYSSNWQTRTSCGGESRTLSEQDVLGVLAELRGEDRTLKELYDRYNKVKKQADGLKKTLEKSDAYRKERDRAKKKAMMDAITEIAESQKLREELHELGMKYPAYTEIYKSWQNGDMVPNYEDELVALSMAGDGKTTTVYKPSSGKFIGDIDLHFDADKLLFTSFRDKGELCEASGTLRR